MILTYTLPSEEDGSSLSRALRRFGLSATLLSRAKAAGALRVNGLPAHTNALCRAGDVLSVDIGAAEPPMELLPEDGPLEILYEDDALLAVNKPQGLLTHPSHARRSGTLANHAAGYLLRRGEPPRCHVVTRLDRDTSGVVLFAKNAYVRARTARPEKTYLAEVLGVPRPSSGTLSAPIARLSPDGMARGVRADGQAAYTRYETVSTSRRLGIPVTLLRLFPETGRTHQLRVHCAYLGHPILGDALYASPASRAASEALGIGAQRLHAARLRLAHPLTGASVELSAPPPWR